MYDKDYNIQQPGTVKVAESDIYMYVVHISYNMYRIINGFLCNS